MIATLSGDSLIKGVFSGTLGFMFATVGIAPIDSAQRFTFGSIQLMSGVGNQEKGLHGGHCIGWSCGECGVPKISA